MELVSESNLERNNHCYSYEEPEEKRSRLTRLWHRCQWKKILTFGSLLLGYFMCNMCFSIVMAFFPEEAKNKGASFLLVGVMMGCSPLFLVLTSPVVGYLLPITGTLPPIFLGLLLLGTSTIGLGFVLLIPSTWGFVVIATSLRLTCGVGAAMFVTATFALPPQLFPKHISTAVGLGEVAVGLGFVAGPLVGALLYKAGGYKAPFLALGGLVLALVLPCTILVWKIKIVDRSKKQTLPLKTIFNICTNFTIIVLVLALTMPAIGFMVVTFQPLLNGEFHLRYEYSTLILSSSAVCYIVVSTVLGPVVDKVGHNRWFVISGMIILTLEFIMLGLITSIGRWYVLLYGFGDLLMPIGSSLGIIPVYHDILQIAKKYASEKDSQTALASFVSGIVSSCAYLGEFAGAVLGGLLTNYMSFPRSALIIGEILLTEVLLLIGVTVINLDLCHKCKSLLIRGRTMDT